MEPFEITLRDAETGDLARVRAMLVSADLPADDIDDLDPKAFTVAEDGDELVAAAALEACDRVGLLRSIVVVPGWRGRGLGRDLVENRLEHGRRLGLTRVYLLTTTAAGYFEGLGFRRVDRGRVPAQIRATSEFSHLCPATAEVMALDLA